MNRQVATMIGSGTVPYAYGILPPASRGNQSGTIGERYGLQTVVANPEDFSAVDAFAVSGVSIGMIPVRVWGPGINSLPRQRSVTIRNEGPGIAVIGPDSTSVIDPSGMTIPAGNFPLTIPLMHNVSIWARSVSSSQLRMLAY